MSQQVVARQPLQLLGKVATPALAPMEDGGHVLAGDTAELGDFADGLRERERMRFAGHGDLPETSIGSHTTLSREFDIEADTTFCPPSVMEGTTMTNPQWPQQQVFKKLVLAYRKEHGISPEQFAGLMDIKSSTLHNSLYDRRYHPSLEFVERACKILNCPASDLMDDTARDNELGINSSDMSSAKKLVSKLIIAEVENPEISDEQALKYLEAFRAMVNAGKKPTQWTRNGKLNK